MAQSGFASDRWRKDMIESLAELHLEPAGRQVLTLFKIDKLVPFKNEYIEATRKLKADYDRMRKGETP